LAGLGLEGVNNYNDFWNARRVYGENSITYWRHDSPQLKSDIGNKTQKGIEFTLDMNGCVLYGPYTSIDAGTYKVALTFSPETELGTAIVDVVAFGARETLVVASNLTIDEVGRLVLQFATPKTLSQLEVRLHVKGQSEGIFEALELCALGPYI
jgi:hypothetical protein